jgi:hypothetical protein
MHDQSTPSLLVTQSYPQPAERWRRGDIDCFFRFIVSGYHDLTDKLSGVEGEPAIDQLEYDLSQRGCSQAPRNGVTALSSKRYDHLREIS